MGFDFVLTDSFFRVSCLSTGGIFYNLLFFGKKIIMEKYSYFFSEKKQSWKNLHKNFTFENFKNDFEYFTHNPLPFTSVIKGSSLSTTLPLFLKRGRYMCFVRA